MQTKRVRTLSEAKKVYAIHSDRTVGWFGGVNYENLEKAINGIKKLLTKNSAEEITLLVSSYGGATGIGMSFFDTVKSVLKPNLTTIGTGDVDSSGVIVFLAGGKRFLTKNTTMLFHLGGRTLEGSKRYSTTDLEDILKENRLKDYQYACVVADATEGRCTTERILEMMSKNTILTAEEAVNMGLAHSVLG